MTSTTDANLLFGVLALQADAITQAQFVEACTLWATHKNDSLAGLLQARGWISADDRADVERLVQRKLTRLNGDARASLLEVTSPAVLQSLARISSEEIRQSLADLTPGPESAGSTTLAWINDSRGRYTLTRLHAQGGIGQVWLARDAELDREVALKEMRPEQALNRRLWARFLQEARITGQLEHPGIVPIYQLGPESDDQPPFYTMRFVRGRTLTQAVRDYHGHDTPSSLELRSLLAAFVSVCNAVSYAHSRGVVHRDLKGDNVLLGDYGEVVVLDWGLARRLAEVERADANEPTLPDPARTQQGQVLGTPVYMAPEQAEGRLDLIDARTDVYGLGGMLYEILTGRPPFSGGTTEEILRRVIRESPAPPRQVRRDVPPALEAVCLKAMAKRPGERYPCVAELSSDVERWLADEPVTAHRDALAVRLARWGRRHRTLVASLAMLVLTAMTALGAGLVLVERERSEKVRAFDQAEAQRERAEAAFQQARQAVDTWFTQVSQETLLNEPGMHPLRERLLRNALEYYQTFQKEQGDDPRLARELALAQLRLGLITLAIGSREEALALLEKATGMLEAQRAGSPDLAVPLAQAHTSLAQLLIFAGQFESGERQALRGIELLEPVCTPAHPESEPFRYLGRCHGLLAVSRTRKEQFASAEASFQKSLEVYRPATQRFPGDRELRRMLALACNNYGVFLGSADRAGEGHRWQREAIGELERLALELPGSASVRIELARTFGSLLIDLLARGRYVEADAPALRAVLVADRLAQENPRLKEALQRQAVGLMRLGEVRFAQGRTRLALRHLDRGIELREQMLKTDPKDRTPLFDLAWSLSVKGRLLELIGRGEEGLSAVERAATINEDVVKKSPGRSDYTSDWLIARGDVNRRRLALGKVSAREAITPQKEVVEARRALLGGSYRLSEMRMYLALDLRDLGDMMVAAGSQDAGPVLAEALREIEGSLNRHPDYPRYRQARALILLSQAHLLRAQKKPGEAEKIVRNAEAELASLAGADSTYAFEAARTQALLGQYRRDVSDSTEAARWNERAIESLRQGIAKGFDAIHPLRTDPALADLRPLPAFQNLLRELEDSLRTPPEERKVPE